MQISIKTINSRGQTIYHFYSNETKSLFLVFNPIFEKNSGENISFFRWWRKIKVFQLDLCKIPRRR